MAIEVLDSIDPKVAKRNQADFVLEPADVCLEDKPTQPFEAQKEGTGASAILSGITYGYFLPRWHIAKMNSTASLLDAVWQPDEDVAVSRKPSEEELLDSWDRYLQEHWDELAAQYRGKYVAISRDIVFDSDEDLVVLATRVYATLGYRPIFMPYIGEKEQVYEFTAPF